MVVLDPKAYKIVGATSIPCNDSVIKGKTRNVGQL